MPRVNELLNVKVCRVKDCTSGGQPLPVECFAKNVNNPDGYRYECRNCEKRYRRTQLYKERDRRYHKLRKPSAARKNPKKNRNSILKHKYGFGLKEFNHILAYQGFRCAVCRTDNPPKCKSNPNGWAVDHDHKTGLVRGILCNPCNTLLGQAKDNQTVLLGAVHYLECHRLGMSSATIVLANGWQLPEVENLEAAAQKSDSENCPTDDYPAELESWLIGDATP